MYNRVVLVCKVNVYIPASLDRRSILRYLEIVLTLLTVRGLILTYVVGNIVNNLKILLPDIFLFFASYFKYRKQKTQPYLQSETLFLSIIFRGLFNIFCKLADQS